jgi:hypothetical protein
MRTSLTTLFLWGAGSVASVVCAKSCSYGDNPQIIAHTGEPVGTEQKYNGGQIYRASLPGQEEPRQCTNTSCRPAVNLYISKPQCKSPKVGVLYMTDVFGIQLAQNKL